MQHETTSLYGASAPAVINGEHDELYILRFMHRALIVTFSSYAIR